MESKKCVLLLTENRESEFLHKIRKAAELARQELLIAEPNFRSLVLIAEEKIGIVILNSEELKRIADYVHRAIRVLHFETPIMLFTERQILLDILGTERFDKNISVKKLSVLIRETMQFEHEHLTASRDFSTKMDQLRELTGEPLSKGIEKLRSETLGNLKKKFTSIRR